MYADDDLEEGEISDDEDPLNLDNEEPLNQDEDCDYEIVPRPVGNPTLSLNKQPAGSSRTMGVSLEYHNKCKPSTSMNIDQDLDKTYSSSESSDSDDEGPSQRKCRRMPMPSNAFQHNVPNSQGINFNFAQTATETVNMQDSFKLEAVSFQQKRKPNKVWCSVVQDDEVSSIFGRVDVEEYNEKHILIDRGPETYSIKYKNIPRIPARTDSSSVSSGGLSDEEVAFFRSRCSKNSDMAEDHPSGARPIRTASKRRQRNKRKNRMINKMRRMSSDQLCDYISEKLQEPKKTLIGLTIYYLGKEETIALFLKTMKIERRGGLLILNQQRRRTPGGVFLYLLRGDRKYPKKLVDKIFKEEKFKLQGNRKRARKDKFLRHKKALEEKKKEFEERGKKGENETSPNDPDDHELPDQPVSVESEESSTELKIDEHESSEDSDEYYGLNATPGCSQESTMEDCLDLHCDYNDLPM